MARFEMARGRRLDGVQLGCDGVAGPVFHYSIRDTGLDGSLDIICSEAAADWISRRLVAPGLSADNVAIDKESLASAAQ